MYTAMNPKWEDELLRLLTTRPISVLHSNGIQKNKRPLVIATILSSASDISEFVVEELVFRSRNLHLNICLKRYNNLAHHDYSVLRKYT